MEKINDNHCKNTSMRKFAFGIIIMAAGALLLLHNLDILPNSVKDIVFSWQMLLIAIGFVNIFSWKDRFVGVILIAVGTFFLLPDLVYFNFNFVKLFWPVLLITVGFLVIAKGFGHKDWRNQLSKTKLHDDFIDETNIFGGSKTILDKQKFKGGKITNIFGGSEINLTQVELEEGNNELEVTCIFGGVVLIVPSDWKIKNRVSNILGGFGDKRQILSPGTDSNKTLTITGVTIFGGGEIKSY
jgi:predicted membrane protein